MATSMVHTISTVGWEQSMKSCWDIKKECPFRGTDSVGAKCPAFAGRLSCWEFDWLGFHRAMPDGAEKDEWKRMMLDWCSKCEVRDSHGREVDCFLERLSA